VRISPATLGQNHFAVELSDANATLVGRVQLTLTYLDGDLGSQPLILQHSWATSGTWETDSTAMSQPGQWQADLLVRRQGQDDVRSTMRFSVVALTTTSAETSASAAYPPLPSWLPLAAGGATAFAMLCALMVLLLRGRTRRRLAPLEPEDLGALLRGRDPFHGSVSDPANEPVGAGQARQPAQRSMGEEGPAD
jgi:hypothetical protein